MSVEFEVKVNSKTIQEFEALLADWAVSYEAQTGGKVRITALYQPDRFYLFGPGSIRGFTLTPSDSFFKGGRVEVRLNVLSSRADWRLCFFILEKLSREQRSTVQAENGQILHLSALSPASAERRGLEEVQAGLRFLRAFLIEQAEPILRLPNPRYDIAIHPEDFTAWTASPDPARAFETDLAARTAPLAACRHASLVLLKDGLTLNALGFEAAIYPASDYAALSKSGAQPLPGQPPELRYVRFSDFLDIFEGSLERVQSSPPGYYLPGIDLSQAQDLERYARLHERGQDELPKKA